jgi:hypothetical protein
VVVSVTPVREEDKARLPLTWRALRHLLEIVYKNYKRISVDASHTLVDFLTAPLQMTLIGDARRKKYLKFPLSDKNFIDVATDELVYTMLMEYMRPKSHDEYEKALYAAVKHFPRNAKDFVVKDYDQNISITVDQIVSDVILFDGYMRYGILEEQEKDLPGLWWGDHAGVDRGAIQIATQCLAPYVEEFKTLIMRRNKGGVKALRDVKSLEAWGDLVLEVNDHYTQEAMRYRASDLHAKPVEKAATVQREVEELAMQKGFISGRMERRAFEGRRRTDAGDLGRIEQVQDDWYAVEGQEYEWDEESYAAHRFGPQLHAFDWENPAEPRKGPQPVRNLPASAGRGYGGRAAGRGRGSDGRGRFGPRAQAAYAGGRGPPPGGPTRPPKGFTPDAPLVCFKFALGGCDKGDKCEYAHDRALAAKYLARMVKRYTGSKFYDPKITADDPPSQQFQVTEMSEEQWLAMLSWERELGEGVDDEDEQLVEDSVSEHGGPWHS